MRNAFTFMKFCLHLKDASFPGVFSVLTGATLTPVCILQINCSGRPPYLTLHLAARHSSTDKLLNLLFAFLSLAKLVFFFLKSQMSAVFKVAESRQWSGLNFPILSPSLLQAQALGFKQ